MLHLPRKPQIRDFEAKLGVEFPFMCRKEVTAEQWEKGGYSLYDAYGCDVGKGWYELLRNLCLDITKAYEAAGLPVDIIVDQVKEKFGTLRFYYHPKGQDPGFHALDFLVSGTSLRMQPGSTDLHNEVARVVSKWEEESASVCEECGAPGETRTDLGWILTLCVSCYEDKKTLIEEKKLQSKESKKDRKLRIAKEKKVIHEQTLICQYFFGQK